MSLGGPLMLPAEINWAWALWVSFRRTSVYRKIAFGAYDPLCAHCGFGIPAVLEVAHIDGNRQNNDPVNLIIL